MTYYSIENHSGYSLLDGLAAPSKYFDRAKEIGVAGVAITDHASIASVVDLYEAANKTGIRGLIGIEANIAEDDIDGQKVRQYSHILIYPKNEIGWKNLLKLNYLGTTENRFYYKSRIYKKDLFEHSEGLVVSSNCIGSILPRKVFTDINSVARSKTYQEASTYIRKDWEQSAKQLIEEYQSVFKDDFYAGCNCHGMPAQELQRDLVRSLCNKYNIKFQPDVDCHFPSPKDHEAHERLLCISTGKTIHQRERMRDEGTDLLFGENANYFMYEPSQMLRYFTQNELNNTQEIFDKCNFTISRQDPVIPSICDNPDKVLTSLCKSELNNRDFDEQYKLQLERELELYVEFKLSGYMLLVRDVFDEAKKLGIRCCCRGSVSGSLVAYLLGITTLDPIKYKLYFTRFLNKGRLGKIKKTLPDCDIDVDSDKRKILINRLKEKFGENNCAQMATYGYIGAKAAIKDAFRITAKYEERELFQSIAEKISQYIPNKTPEETEVTLESVLETSDNLKDFATQYPEQFEAAMSIQNCIRNQSVHAAGLVITPMPIVEMLPIHYNKNMQSLVTNCDMQSAEYLGGVKLDLLGLKSLSVHSEFETLYKEFCN